MLVFKWHSSEKKVFAQLFDLQKCLKIWYVYVKRKPKQSWSISLGQKVERKTLFSEEWWRLGKPGQSAER